ncbi:MAG TPA: hypothetical protein VK586_21625 [Streptosporangiaceae bacterium]|nr:hypothetical protein [Streptosporangiaceae bacterium]
MADIHGSPADAPQMPAAPGAGPAPAPYGGADLSPEPPEYAVDPGVTDPAEAVMSGVTGLGTAESPSAHDIAAGTADAPYSPGPLAPIGAMGDADAGGRDDVAASVAEAVANATARYHEHESDTYVQGSTIGDIVTLPPSPLDPGVAGGLTDPAGGYYDPPRDY